MKTLERSLHPQLPDEFAVTELRPQPEQGRWAFLGEGSLPSSPLARQHEKRGRKWLVVSYLFCPCHLPLAMALLGAVFGSTALGAALTGNALRIGVALTTVWTFVLWRGFRQIRRAKRIEASGGVVTCSPTGCTVATPGA